MMDFTQKIINISHIKNIKINQQRTGNPRPTKSRPRVKCFGFNFTCGSESPFETRFTQPYGFACQRQKPLGYEPKQRIIKKSKKTSMPRCMRYKQKTKERRKKCLKQHSQKMTFQKQQK